MPLSPDLRDKLLTFNCLQCSHALAKKGAWFVGMSRFKCGGCGHTVPITYGDKIALATAWFRGLGPRALLDWSRDQLVAESAVARRT